MRTFPGSNILSISHLVSTHSVDRKLRLDLPESQTLSELQVAPLPPHFPFPRGKQATFSPHCSVIVQYPPIGTSTFGSLHMPSSQETSKFPQNHQQAVPDRPCDAGTHGSRHTGFSPYKWLRDLRICSENTGYRPHTVHPIDTIHRVDWLGTTNTCHPDKCLRLRVSRILAANLHLASTTHNPIDTAVNSLARPCRRSHTRLQIPHKHRPCTEPDQ